MDGCNTTFLLGRLPGGCYVSFRGCSTFAGNIAYSLLAKLVLPTTEGWLLVTPPSVDDQLALLAANVDKQIYSTQLKKGHKNSHINVDIQHTYIVDYIKFTVLYVPYAVYIVKLYFYG